MSKMMTQDKKKHSFLVYTKSKEYLLQETVQLQQNPRRTKIMVTVGTQNLSYEKIKSYISAGANAITINMAYMQNKQCIKDLARIRDQLETELGQYIPLNLLLKGTQVRLGQLRSEVFLRSGDIIRLIGDPKVIGDQHLMSVDYEHFLDNIQVGGKIVVGEVIFEVVAIENSDQAYQYLMDTYPQLYQNPQQQYKVKNKSDDGSSETHSKCHSGQGSFKSLDDKPKPDPQLNKYKEQLLKHKEIKKNKKFRVLVCQVKVDCIIKALRPLSIMTDNDDITSLKRVITHKHQQRVVEEIEEEDQDSSDEGEESQITSKDIVFMDTAKRHNFDSVTISNIRKAAEIKDLRHVLGDENKMKILVRITTIEAVQNFSEIVKESDGVIIARSYILLQSAIELVVQQVLDMIRKAHQLFKTVMISTQILESMCNSFFPNFPEVEDIANLVNQDIDAIILTRETIHGNYPIESISTLSRVCRFAENKQIHSRIEKFSCNNPRIASTKHFISNAIAEATVDAAYRLKAKLIVVFTSTGSTALKISKLQPPCPIMSITGEQHTARQLQLISGVTSICFGTLTGTSLLKEKIVKLAREKHIISKGDYCLMLSGSIENVSGQINALKIIQIE